MKALEQRARVVEIARSWIGTPYHHHARLKGIGVDCAQLLCAVYEEAGACGHIDTGHYAHDWHLHHSRELFLETMESAGAFKVERELVAGDSMVFRYGRTFSHGSVYAGDGQFVHAYLGMGVVLSRLDEVPLVGRPSQIWSFW